MKRAQWLFMLAATSYGQGWQQWGQNALHTGTAAGAAQRLDRILGEFVYDSLAEPIRLDNGGSLLVHYPAPLVDGDDVFVMSRGDSRWVSCKDAFPPCGAQLWNEMQWGVTKLRWDGGRLAEQWTAVSSWKPPPDNGSGWEPVFHPALFGRYLYMPGVGGMVMQFDRETGELIDCLTPFDDIDPNRYVTSPLTIDAAGSIYYTTMRLDAAEPWSRDVVDAWLVKIDAAGPARKISFHELVTSAPERDCVTTFSGQPLPWPPSADARPPLEACGGQRPGLNAAPAVAADGTIYVVSRAHLNSAYGYLVAAWPDLSPKWAASLRDRLQDGCDVLIPPSGTPGGCREGSRRGVDPATNEMPAGRVSDLSTASPVVGPDGSVLYGAATRYNYSRGHLFRFSSSGDFLSAYDFGWDITPAVYVHDGTWSIVIKDNHYPVGSYCGVLGFCGQAEPRYRITSLDAELRPEWSFQNTNDQSCDRMPDGSLKCETRSEGFEWCVNMIAVDRDGVVHANSEDGNVYAIDRTGRAVGKLFLKKALGAAYTPLAIGDDGRVYTQNDGVLFVVGQ